MRYVPSTTLISDFVEDAFPQHLGLLLLLLLLLLTVSFIVQHTLWTLSTPNPRAVLKYLQLICSNFSDNSLQPSISSFPSPCRVLQRDEKKWRHPLNSKALFRHFPSPHQSTLSSKWILNCRYTSMKDERNANVCFALVRRTNNWLAWSLLHTGRDSITHTNYANSDALDLPEGCVHITVRHLS